MLMELFIFYSINNINSIVNNKIYFYLYELHANFKLEDLLYQVFYLNFLCFFILYL